jgi:hypothetical protein
MAVDPSNGNRSGPITLGTPEPTLYPATCHHSDQGLTGARLGSPQKPFDLREGLLGGVEVRRSFARRQVEKLAALLFDQSLPEGISL